MPCMAWFSLKSFCVCMVLGDKPPEPSDFCNRANTLSGPDFSATTIAGRRRWALTRGKLHISISQLRNILSEIEPLEKNRKDRKSASGAGMEGFSGYPANNSP